MLITYFRRECHVRKNDTNRYVLRPFFHPFPGAQQVLAAEYEIKIAYETNPGEPTDVGVQEWARILKEISGGKVEPFCTPAPSSVRRRTSSR